MFLQTPCTSCPPSGPAHAQFQNPCSTIEISNKSGCTPNNRNLVHRKFGVAKYRLSSGLEKPDVERFLLTLDEFHILGTLVANLRRRGGTSRRKVIYNFFRSTGKVLPAKSLIEPIELGRTARVTRLSNATNSHAIFTATRNPIPKSVHKYCMPGVSVNLNEARE